MNVVEQRGAPCPVPIARPVAVPNATSNTPPNLAIGTHQIVAIPNAKPLVLAHAVALLPLAFLVWVCTLAAGRVSCDAWALWSKERDGTNG